MVASSGVELVMSTKINGVPVATYVRRAGLDLGLDYLFFGFLFGLLFGAGSLVMGMVLAGTVMMLLSLLLPSKAGLRALRTGHSHKALEAG